MAFLLAWNFHALVGARRKRRRWQQRRRRRRKDEEMVFVCEGKLRPTEFGLERKKRRIRGRVGDRDTNKAGYTAIQSRTVGQEQ